MEAELIAFVALLFFSIACNGLISSVSTGTQLFRLNDYNYRALKVERAYKIFAWGLLTFIMLVNLIYSFLETLNSNF